MSMGEEYTFDKVKFAPYVKIDEDATGVPHCYEPSLLEYLGKKGHVTLINPSMGTVFRAEHIKYSIHITHGSSIYKKELQNALVKTNRLDVEYIDVPQGICYLGTNGMRNVPDNLPWVSLLPNPFIANFPYSNFSIYLNKKGVSMHYDRKDRLVRAELKYEMDRPMFRYSPHQVDAMFLTKGKSAGDSYYLESNFSFPAFQGDSTGDHIFFLPDYPACGFDEKYLYDIVPSATEPYDATDTYLSRRSRMGQIAVERGLELFPLGSNGTRGISFNTVRPVKSNFPSLWFDSSQSWKATASSLSDCEVYGLSGPLHAVGLGEANFTSKAYVFGENNYEGETVDAFPKGYLSSVPFDPVKRAYCYHFVRGGTYFIFTKLSQLKTFQLAILHKMYRSSFGRKSLYSIPPDFPTCKPEVSMFSKVSERSKCGFGITPRELSAFCQCTVDKVMAGIRAFPSVCANTVDGELYFYDVDASPLRYMVNGESRHLGDVWRLWVENREIICETQPDVNFFESFFYANCRPVLRVLSGKGKFKMKGCQVRVKVPPRQSNVMYDDPLDAW